MNAVNNVAIHIVTQREWKQKLKILLSVYFQFTLLQCYNRNTMGIENKH